MSRATCSPSGDRSVDNPHQFVLVEGFESSQAGQAHVNSEHFRTAMAWMPYAIAETPEIINVKVPQCQGSAMSRFRRTVGAGWASCPRAATSRHGELLPVYPAARKPVALRSQCTNIRLAGARNST
jgi:Antibiotic biosynthesis monooxygenase